MGDRFDEQALLADIVAKWGEHGAHADVCRFMIDEVTALRAENELLRTLAAALRDRPFRGTPDERRDRMYGSDWMAVHDALDAWEALEDGSDLAGDAVDDPDDAPRLAAAADRARRNRRIARRGDEPGTTAVPD